MNDSHSDESPKDDTQQNTAKKASIPQIALSVVAAAFGVSTNKNRERDFSQSSPIPYIIGGIVFTVVFVLSIIGVVSLVLP